MVGDPIAAHQAYHLLSHVGLRDVVVHDAGHEIHLQDGRTLYFWTEGYRLDREWTLQAAPLRL